MTQLLPPPFPAAGAVATLEKTELQKLRKMKFGLAFLRALRYNLLRTCRCVGIGRRGGFKIHCQRWRAGSSPATGTIVGASFVSLAPTYFISQSALMPLLLLSKSNPLRWALIWFF